jgi:hypothetical protein
MTNIFTKDILQLIFSVIDDSKTCIALAKVNKLANRVSKEMLILEVVHDNIDIKHWITKRLPSYQKYGLEVIMDFQKKRFRVEYNIRSHHAKCSWDCHIKECLKYEWSNTTFVLTWKIFNTERITHYHLWGYNYYPHN